MARAKKRTRIYLELTETEAASLEFYLVAKRAELGTFLTAVIQALREARESMA